MRANLSESNLDRCSLVTDRRSFVTAACAAGIAATGGAALAAMSPATPALAEEAGEAVGAASAGEAWDAEYDVIVIGYGLAGGTAARHAADAGAKVLLIDGAPDGSEGGNSKFAKQLLASGHDVEAAVTYLKALNSGFEVDEEIVRMFAEKMVAIPEYCKEYLGCDVYSWIGNDDPVLAPFVPEYPELPGSDQFDAYTITETNGDGALWFKAKELVEARAEKVERDGGSAFRDYSLPEAVIRFRQGFGRLIRTKSDRGVVVVTDPRIVTKNYGALFRKSIPASVRTVSGADDLLARVGDFFGDAGRPG